MLKGKLRKSLIIGTLGCITFVGTALTYFAKQYNEKGILIFKANDANSLSVLFFMIFLIMGISIYLIIENRSLIKQNQQLLYKLLEQGEYHYNQIQKSNMNTREVLFESFERKDSIA